MHEDTSNRYLLQSVHRAAKILRAFSVERPHLSLGEITELVGMSKPGAFRVLATLEHNDLVTKADDGATYTLGFGVATLASVRLRQTNLREIAIPHMRKLRDGSNETVVLCLRVGDFRVHVEQCESYRPFHRLAQIGEHVPLYAGAASKVLLAGLTDDEIDGYLGRVELTAVASNTITDRDRLLDELRLVHRQGFAEGHQERAEDTAGVAVPIYGTDDRVVAALQVPLLLQHYSSEKRSVLIPQLAETADAISRDLGAHSHKA